MCNQRHPLSHLRVTPPTTPTAPLPPRSTTPFAPLSACTSEDLLPAEAADGTREATCDEESSQRVARGVSPSMNSLASIGLFRSTSLNSLECAALHRVASTASFNGSIPSQGRASANGSSSLRFCTPPSAPDAFEAHETLIHCPAPRRSHARCTLRSDTQRELSPFSLGFDDD